MTKGQPDRFPYLPLTSADREEMLKAIGVESFAQLVGHIPEELRAKAKVLNLPEGLSELELTQMVSALANKNQPASSYACFIGGGSYQRFVPAVVPAICSRSEFATAYTPYQPEVSQGSLQAIYEFQSAICLITDMEVANASMYDGPTACAEAALMALRLTDRSKIALSQTVNPEYAMVCETYLRACDHEYITLPALEGVTDSKHLKDQKDLAAVIVQYPNYFGVLEDFTKLAQQAHEAGALLIVIVDPISLGLIKPPGQFGADIVVGDAQPCGNFLSFGGPSAGFLATRKDYVRQLPGRLCGKTVDIKGRTAYTLTLQTREQHIRRSKATSNICTNQALNALAMLVYLTALGPEGLKEVAEISFNRAHYLAEHLCQIEGVQLAFDQPFFNEFVIKTTQPASQLLAELSKDGILGGIDLNILGSSTPNSILVTVTEMNDRAQLDHYVSCLKSLLTEQRCEMSPQRSTQNIRRLPKASQAVS